MKIGPMAISFWVFALVIAMFNNTLIEDQYNPQPAGDDDIQGSTMWNIIMNPMGFQENGFFWKFTLAFLTLGAGGIILAGVGVYAKSDMIVLTGMMAGWAGLVVIPIASMYSFFQGGLRYAMCTGVNATLNGTCGPSLIGAGIIVGIPTFFYGMACTEWWTARSTLK